MEIPNPLKKLIEIDLHMIKNGYLVKLPAKPNVIDILNDFYQHFGTEEIQKLNEQDGYKLRSRFHKTTEGVPIKLSQMREVIDGLRIYFDFTCTNILLYKSEINQFPTAIAVYKQLERAEKAITNVWENENIGQQNITEDSEKNTTPIGVLELGCHQIFKNLYVLLHRSKIVEKKIKQTFGIVRKKSKLRKAPSFKPSTSSSKPGSSKEILQEKYLPSSIKIGNIKPISYGSLGVNGTISITSSKIVDPLAITLLWKLLPDWVYQEEVKPPCLIYGAQHLARLFVKLPELLESANIIGETFDLIVKNVLLIMLYLADHEEWFNKDCYYKYQ